MTVEPSPRVIMLLPFSLRGGGCRKRRLLPPRDRPSWPSSVRAYTSCSLHFLPMRAARRSTGQFQAGVPISWVVKESLWVQHYPPNSISMVLVGHNLRIYPDRNDTKLREDHLKARPLRAKPKHQGLRETDG